MGQAVSIPQEVVRGCGPVAGWPLWLGALKAGVERAKPWETQWVAGELTRREGSTRPPAHSHPSGSSGPFHALPHLPQLVTQSHWWEKPRLIRWAQTPGDGPRPLGKGKKGPPLLWTPPHTPLPCMPPPASKGTTPRMAKAVREALCTSSIKIMAAPPSPWRRSPLSGTHIPAPWHLAWAHLMDWLTFLVIAGGSHSS